MSISESITIIEQVLSSKLEAHMTKPKAHYTLGSKKGERARGKIVSQKEQLFKSFRNIKAEYLHLCPTHSTSKVKAEQRYAHIHRSQHLVLVLSLGGINTRMHYR